MEQSTRRQFVTGATALAMAAAVPGMLSPASAEEAQATASERITTELPIVENYDYDALERTDYECDILVIGAGFCGLNAAYAARQQGCDVLVVDKGRPGFSGQSPWAGTYNYMDADLGDDITAFREYLRYTGEYIGNLDWIDVWLQDCKEIKQRVEDWGLLDVYPAMFETDYWVTRDYYGYRDEISLPHDRRLRFAKVLDDNGIPWLQHVMITNLVVQDGKCVGAMGFQVTTGTVVSISAKAVIVAAGNGCIIPTGHPIGDNTFDAEWMLYNVGVPIGGKEFEDQHWHNSFAPGNNWVGSDSRYYDPNYLCGGAITVKDVSKARYDCDVAGVTKQPADMFAGYYGDGLPYKDFSAQSDEYPTTYLARSANYGINPDDDRMGKCITPSVRWDAPGAAIGMCLHLTSGAFCGFDDFEGKTQIPGLWASGDGALMTVPNGGAYTMGNGFTTSFVSVCGNRAGLAAAQYAKDVDLEPISEENHAAIEDEILQPMRLEKGFAPEWGRDALQGIMAPYWVSRCKTEATLNAALTDVMFMKENCSERFLARNGHQLRLAHEMKHKINACELKLRATLARKESRGTSLLRMDYPERDDENYAGYFIQTKNPDGGEPIMEFVEAKPEWGRAGIPEDFEVPEYEPEGK